MAKTPDRACYLAWWMPMIGLQRRASAWEILNSMRSKTSYTMPLSIPLSSRDQERRHYLQTRMGFLEKSSSSIQRSGGSGRSHILNLDKD